MIVLGVQWEVVLMVASQRRPVLGYGARQQDELHQTTTMSMDEQRGMDD